MSEIRGYKCDICGRIIATGCRISGNKRWMIGGGGKSYAYRFDICKDCMGAIEEAVKSGKPGAVAHNADSAQREGDK